MSFKIIAFSDHHAHNFQYGADRVEGEVAYKSGYYNSRFLQSLEVLREIEEATRGHQLTLFGGDLFHQRGAVSTDVLMGTYAAINSLNKYNKLIMIPGNHDFADRSGAIHSLLGLETNDEYTPLIAPAWHDSDFVRVWTVPYCEDKAQFLLHMQIFQKEMLSRLAKNKFHILLAHQGIQGSLVGSDFVLTSNHDISVDDIPDCFNLCLFGHYHKHQRVKDNVYYIGATHQHNWGDANDPRGFLRIIINDDFTYSIEQIETQSSSKFIVTNKAIKARPIDFVKSTNEKLTAQDLGNPKVFENIEVKVVEDDPKEFVPPSHSVDDILETWATLQGVSKDYLELGKQLIKDVKHE